MKYLFFQTSKFQTFKLALALILLAIAALFAPQTKASDIPMPGNGLENAKPYEFLHCLPSWIFTGSENVNHILIDLRDADNNRVYQTEAPANKAAAEIQKWLLLIPRADTTLYDSNYDLQWSSKDKSLQISMVIQSTNAELLEGLVLSNQKETAYTCKDIAQ